jgi:hypothetical protein
MASIKRRREQKKIKFVSSFFAERNAVRISDALQHRRTTQIVSVSDGMNESPSLVLRPAHRNPDVYRLERGRITAPATAIGFLKRERLLNPQFVRYRETISASRRRFRSLRFQIPARARAARCDRTADRKWRENYHFDLGYHEGVLLGDLAVNLNNTIQPQEILAGIGRMNLRDT